MPYRPLVVATIKSAATILLTLAVASPVLAQGRGQGSSPSIISSRSGGDDNASSSYRSFLVGLPVFSTDGAGARLELNLYGRASLALEGSYQRRGEDLAKADIKRTGESMMTQAKQVDVMLFRYSRPYTLSGFYYGLGLGYRQQNADWHERASPSYVALADATYANHDAVLTGPTGHLRLGYRYVGTDIPLLIGAYLGVRHFQATVTDEPSGNSSERPLTSGEKAQLVRRFETAPEAGIEVGFVL